MKNFLKNILMKNTPLKVCSLILGYAFWCFLGNIQPIKTEITVPICFYNTDNNKELVAPETVTITLVGKRSPLHTLDHTKLAIHINAQNMTVGTHPIAITSDTLFLPDSIKLVHYMPAPIILTVREITKSTIL